MIMKVFDCSGLAADALLHRVQFVLVCFVLICFFSLFMLMHFPFQPCHAGDALLHFVTHSSGHLNRAAGKLNCDAA